MLHMIKNNLNEYRLWLNNWIYSDLPSFDMQVDYKIGICISYALLLPTVVLLHIFVLCGLLTALFVNVVIAPIGNIFK